MQKIRTSTMPRARRKIETITTQLCSPETKQRVTSELLKIGLGFNYIGTHYLTDCIGMAVESHLASQTSMRAFVGVVTSQVSEKWGVDKTTVCTQMKVAIDRAMTFGNIDYLLEILQGTFDYDKQKVSYSVLVMNLAEKIRIDIENECQGTREIKELIIEGIESINDPKLLDGICNIVMSLKGGAAV